MLAEIMRRADFIFAGWNVLTSLGLIAVTLFAASKADGPRRA